MNVSKVILSRDDSAPAILQRDRVVTYCELRELVVGLAGLAGEDASEPRERIGIFSENNPFFVAAYLGIIQAGMVAVPFQTEIGEKSFQRIVASAGIRRLFVSRRFESKVRPWAEAVECRVQSEECEKSKGEPRNTLNTRSQNSATPPIHHSAPASLHHSRPAPSASSSPLAALMFTSGSTGEPKGVMITHRNIECNARDIIQYMGLTAEDRCMVVLPFHYCFGLSLLHTHMMTGGSVVLNNDFRLYPETVLREMQEKECTGIAGVPSTYQILLRKSRFRQMSFPKLRWFQQAGGKLPNPCIQEIRESFPHVKYFLMYGQTEATARLSYLPPERLTDKLGSIGTGLPSTKLEVLKADGTPVKPSGQRTEDREQRTVRSPTVNSRQSTVDSPPAQDPPSTVPPSALMCDSQPSTLNSQPVAPAFSDEIGEIVATGDNISPGYWNDPEETAKYFRDWKLYTGDLARVDEDGFIFIVERERDMIKSGGNRVSAKEIEDVIAEIPEVVEVAVVGAPHELLGESIRAFVVLHPKAVTSETEVLMHCRKRLPAFKTPAEVVFLKAMPHNSAGKVLKKELKGLIQSPASQVQCLTPKIHV